MSNKTPNISGNKLMSLSGAKPGKALQWRGTLISASMADTTGMRRLTQWDVTCPACWLQLRKWVKVWQRMGCDFYVTQSLQVYTHTIQTNNAVVSKIYTNEVVLWAPGKVPGRLSAEELKAVLPKPPSAGEGTVRYAGNNEV